MGDKIALEQRYGATNYLPNLALELVTGSVLGSLLVPSLVRALDAGGRSAAERLAGAYLGLVALVFTGFAALEQRMLSWHHDRARNS